MSLCSVSICTMGAKYLIRQISSNFTSWLEIKAATWYHDPLFVYLCLKNTFWRCNIAKSSFSVSHVHVDKILWLRDVFIFNIFCDCLDSVHIKRKKNPTRFFLFHLYLFCVHCIYICNLFIKDSEHITHTMKKMTITITIWLICQHRRKPTVGLASLTSRVSDDDLPVTSI